MENVFPILIASVVVIFVIAVLIVILTKNNRKVGIDKGEKKKSKNQVKNKNRNQIIREATKKLTQDAHNVSALTALGDLYFHEHLWEKAYPVYETLWRISGAHSDVVLQTVTLRLGICAIKLEKIPEALQALTNAYKYDSHNFDVNYNLGVVCFMNKEYDKAIPCFKKAIVLNTEATGVFLMLGKSYYNAHHYHESLPCFKKALDEDPQNKEALYDMADAMTEDGYGDKAMKVFLHLRPDPVYGARSSLSAGLLHSRNGDHESAIQDYEIGLKHENTPPEITIELYYRRAQSYFALNMLPQGIQDLRKVQTINSNYKDTASLLARYQELSQNKNLQIYLTATTSDYVALLRKIVLNIYTDSLVRIQDINVGPIFTDILAAVETSKWEDTEVFRFFRTTGSTGEIYIRDFHGSLHDIKADRGYCITAGTFSEEARKFVDGRPIDLIEKTTLVGLLKKVD